jgi:hypothetical protein
MGGFARFSRLCAFVGLGALVIPFAVGQPLPAPNLPKGEPTGPRQPRGVFGDLGEYQTIEGVRVNGTFTGNSTLLVDTVGGKKLDKPVSIWVENLELPAKKRCVLKGYELGRMIGTPPAVLAAAKEKGKSIIAVQAAWQWQPYFVALVVVEPEGLEIQKPKE